MSNKPTITQGPTMRNPDTLHTVEELRAELIRAEGLVLQLSMQLHDMNSILQRMAQGFSGVIVAHMAKDAERVAAELDAFMAKHVRDMRSPAAGTH